VQILFFITQNKGNFSMTFVNGSPPAGGYIPPGMLTMEQINEQGLTGHYHGMDFYNGVPGAPQAADQAYVPPANVPAQNQGNVRQLAFPNDDGGADEAIAEFANFWAQPLVIPNNVQALAPANNGDGSDGV